MIEIIAVTFVKFLTTTLLKGVFSYATGTVIDGAPSWFYKTDKARLCIYSFEDGGLESVEKAKRKAGIMMINKIDDIIEIVLYDNFRNIEDSKEKLFIRQLEKDEFLPLFVKKNIIFHKIKYEEDVKRSYVKACIENNELIQYQTERTQKIMKKLTHFRADTGFDELDNE